MSPDTAERRPGRGGVPDDALTGDHVTANVQAAAVSGTYQVMPPLAADEYDALKASIAAGYDPAHPVVVDEEGVVLDGHHRQQACAELGITAPAVVLPGLTESQKHDYAVRANLARRHLTTAQKRDLIRAEIDRDPGRSDREIGRLVGADHKTVGSVRRGDTGEIPHPASGPRLAVGDIEYIPGVHARRDRHDGEQIIRRYLQDVYQLPPITIARGRVLVDGFYRWQAYIRQGIAEIPVEDLGDLTDLEILTESARRNSRHGLPMAWPERSQRQLAELETSLESASNAEPDTRLAALAAVIRDADAVVTEGTVRMYAEGCQIAASADDPRFEQELIAAGVSPKRLREFRLLREIFTLGDVLELAEQARDGLFDWGLLVTEARTRKLSAGAHRDPAA